ncbi:6645_t:CDS:2, partial [Cetraspora pellucida]
PLESIITPLNITDDTYINPPSGVDRNLTVFIGIVTYYEKVETRKCLRELYTHNNNALARYLRVNKSPVTIKFILGLPKDEYMDNLEEESKMYGDIVILNITENMNEGKTFEYFSWFAKHREDNYMHKSDDDTFIHLIHYYRDLQDLPREHVYYGNALGYVHGTYTFMGGAGYTLSRDLVIDIVGSNWVNLYSKGYEDWLVGEWTIMIHQIKAIEMLNAIKNWYSEYEEGLPMVRVIRNSTAEGLATKKEIVPECWTALEREQLWNQSVSYKNWFYEAWGFKEGGRYGSMDNIEITG